MLELINQTVNNLSATQIYNQIVEANLKFYEQSIKNLLKQLSFDTQATNAVIVSPDGDAFEINYSFHNALAAMKSVHALAEAVPGSKYIDIVDKFIEKYDRNLAAAIDDTNCQSELHMALWCLKGIYQ